MQESEKLIFSYHGFKDANYYPLFLKETIAYILNH